MRPGQRVAGAQRLGAVRRGGDPVAVVAAQRGEPGVERGGHGRDRAHPHVGRAAAGPAAAPATPGRRRRGGRRARPARWRAPRRRCARRRSARPAPAAPSDSASASTPHTVRQAGLRRPAGEVGAVVGDVQPETRPSPPSGRTAGSVGSCGSSGLVSSSCCDGGQREPGGLGGLGRGEPDLGHGAVVERRAGEVVEHRVGVALDLEALGGLARGRPAGRGCPRRTAPRRWRSTPRPRVGLVPASRSTTGASSARLGAAGAAACCDAATPAGAVGLVGRPSSAPTSSITAIGALSPLRGSVFVMRV